MQLRFAVPSDAGALLRIYDECINTSITFEYALPSEAEFAARIADISAEYPYLALFDGDVPAAYAYACAISRSAVQAVCWATASTATWRPWATTSM